MNTQTKEMTGTAETCLIEPADTDDLAPILELLRDVELPTDGVKDQFPGGYVVARYGAELSAVAGLERYGEVGLLRSVAVKSTERSRGLGRALIEERLRVAEAWGLSAVYLLTTTAPDYFRRLGFVETSRAELPVALSAAPEVASVCPSSATCLVRGVP